MTSTFIGRSRELDALERQFASPRGSLVPLYGRRRVGKTRLILQFLANHRGVFFLGKQSTAEMQLKELLAVAARELDQPLLAKVTLEGWKTALEAILDAWTGSGKLIIVLDEFQWIAGASPELPSVLQELWDLRLRESGEAMIILCGSYVGFMEREVLGQKSPLFGRRTAQIHLQPFSFREAREFQPRYSPSDAARAWFICGGIPLYLEAFKDDRSVEQNIVANLLDEFAPLYREPDFLLREELRELRIYHAIMMTLATESLPTREIARRTGVDARTLSYYLSQLEELGYLRKRYPLTDKPRSTKQMRYVLSDPLLRFWFHFVFPNTSTLTQLGPKKCFASRIRPDLDAYYGRCFESLCREALPLIYEREGVTAAFEIGEYWDKTTQIDVVGLRDDDWTDIGECKWGRVRSRRALEKELRAKAKAYDNGRNASLGLRLFVRELGSAPPSNGESGDIRWHTLGDLYGE
jgi:uncharacterized protein